MIVDIYIYIYSIKVTHSSSASGLKQHCCLTRVPQIPCMLPCVVRLRTFYATNAIHAATVCHMWPHRGHGPQTSEESQIRLGPFLESDTVSSFCRMHRSFGQLFRGLVPKGPQDSQSQFVD